MAPPKKTIEQRYQKMTPREHILLRPDTYIGSTETQTDTMWIYNEELKRMVMEEVTYVPGLYKIFDEILVNAADVYARQSADESLARMTYIKVAIDKDEGAIIVQNDGEPIPVQIHAKERMYVPQMIFGHLLTSDNYDDTDARITGGRNGFGAKLTNIFSKKFVVTCCDKKTGKKFKMIWRNNMSTANPPEIRSYNGSSSVTVKFVPDYERFKLTGLDTGTQKVLIKRVYDIAATTGVRVYLNGERIDIKNFKQYVDLYFDSEVPVQKIYEKSHRWEVVVAASTDSAFHQVSFVNSIATTHGGTHVSHVVDPLVQALCERLNKKGNKELAHLKPAQAKNCLFVFINCQIVNPAFSTQTKELLTTKAAKFGSKYEMGPNVLKSLFKSSIMNTLIEYASSRLESEYKKKMKGTASTDRIRSIPKLEDANHAGSALSKDCILILTEGDSAKTSCVTGLSALEVKERKFYGVFPLKGKLLNVRDATFQQIMDNSEIQNILTILGLDASKRDLDSSHKLRYGQVMIMTDQDYDGSHIKGLLINMFHYFWPNMLKCAGFLTEFVTPIIKAKKGNSTYEFFTMNDYAAWRNSTNTAGWKIKYYKGLGTSTNKEFMEYFSNIQNHKIKFTYVDKNDDDSIDLAFNKKRADHRKEWMQAYRHGDGVDHSIKELRYYDFVHKELIQFSIYDTERSIPSAIDGFKPGQRKVLFGAIRANLVNDTKVDAFASYVSQHSAYHHGETSLQQTIVNMAQDFVGSNNINLFLPVGQFGSRKEGGKDCSAARYIHTKFSPLARLIFHPADDPILEYKNEEGSKIEPTYYVPIIPMVLVNGCEGIGTGFSTMIPNYNPLEIIDNIKRLLNDEEMRPMTPWYRNYTGSIVANDKGGYDCSGCYNFNVGSLELWITELPIHRWTNDYKTFLNTLNAKSHRVILHEDVSTHESIGFRLTVTEEAWPEVSQDGIDKFFRLKTSISTNNMTLFDADGKLQRYKTELDIIRDFAAERFKYYSKRRNYLITRYSGQQRLIKNQIRFIGMVVDEKLVLFKKPKAVLLEELKKLKFEPYSSFELPEHTTDEAHEETVDDYNYLLNMTLWSLTVEYINTLDGELAKITALVDELKQSDEKVLWLKDLEVLREAIVNGGYMDNSIPPTVFSNITERSKKKSQSKKVTSQGTTQQATLDNLIIKNDIGSVSNSSALAATPTKSEVTQANLDGNRSKGKKRAKNTNAKTQSDDDAKSVTSSNLAPPKKKHNRFSTLAKGVTPAINITGLDNKSPQPVVSKSAVATKSKSKAKKELTADAAASSSVTRGNRTGKRNESDSDPDYDYELDSDSDSNSVSVSISDSDARTISESDESVVVVEERNKKGKATANPMAPTSAEIIAREKSPVAEAAATRKRQSPSPPKASTTPKPQLLFRQPKVKAPRSQQDSPQSQEAKTASTQPPPPAVKRTVSISATPISHGLKRRSPASGNWDGSVPLVERRPLVTIQRTEDSAASSSSSTPVSQGLRRRTSSIDGPPPADVDPAQSPPSLLELTKRKQLAHSTSSTLKSEGTASSSTKRGGKSGKNDSASAKKGGKRGTVSVLGQSKRYKIVNKFNPDDTNDICADAEVDIIINDGPQTQNSPQDSRPLEQSSQPPGLSRIVDADVSADIDYSVFSDADSPRKSHQSKGDLYSRYS